MIYLTVLDEFMQKNPRVCFLKRALAVKLSLLGHSPYYASSIINTSPQFVMKWLEEFNKKGVSGLAVECDTYDDLVAT